MVRKVADFGHPTASPVSASTSSMVRSISCISRITLSTENVPIRLPIKFGVSFGENHAFAQMQVAELRHCINGGAIGFRCGNQFQQPHVARRIEKMRAHP